MYRFLLPSLLLIGCDGAGGASGTVAVAGWGEEAPFEGFPNAELSFADGWAVTFTHVVTSFADLELADPDTEEAVAADGTNYVADWHDTPDPVAVTELEVPEGRYQFGFSFVPLTDGATNLTDVDAEIVSAMVDNGWNTYLEGQGEKDGQVVTFKWGMANAARYARCKNGEDETDGVAVSGGETTDATFFAHTDHTYWDRLGTEEASLRFAPIAAWANADGETVLSDLAGVSTAALEDPEGNPILDEAGEPLRYDDAGLGLANLEDFVVYSTARQGHLNGEGQCTISSL